MINFSKVLISLFLLANVVFAQKVGTSEVSLGLGSTMPKENSPFNISNDAAVPKSLILNLGYRVYVADLVALGLRGFGTICTLKGYKVTTKDNPVERETDFSLTNVYMGIESVLLLSESRNIKPYITAMMLYHSGILTNSIMPKNKISGYCWGLGFGLQFKMDKSTYLTLEGVFCYGASKWQNIPFANSSDNKYDPSTILIVSNILFSFK